MTFLLNTTTALNTTSPNSTVAGLRPISMADLSDSSGSDMDDFGPSKTMVASSASSSNSSLIGRRKHVKRQQDSDPPTASSDPIPTDTAILRQEDEEPSSLDNYSLPGAGTTTVTAFPSEDTAFHDINGIPTVSTTTPQSNDNTDPASDSASNSIPPTPHPDFLVFNDTLTYNNSSSSSSNNTNSTDNPSPAFNPTPAVYCPCNCTYISEACCLSPIVHEDASVKRIPLDALPPDSPVCCDPVSGEWLPTASLECQKQGAAAAGRKFTADGGGGFIGLGSVKWNPGNGSGVAVGFPDDEDGGGS